MNPDLETHYPDISVEIKQGCSGFQAAAEVCKALTDASIPRDDLIDFTYGATEALLGKADTGILQYLEAWVDVKLV